MKKIDEYEKCVCGKPAWHRLLMYNSKNAYENDEPYKTVTSCTFCLLEKFTFAIVDAQKNKFGKNVELSIAISVPDEFKNRVKKSRTIQELYTTFCNNVTEIARHGELNLEVLEDNLELDLIKPHSSLEIESTKPISPAYP